MILAEDMTIETVIAKLSYIIGKGNKGKDIEKGMLSNLRGELSIEKEKVKPIFEHYNFEKIISFIEKMKNDKKPENLNKIAQML